MIALKERDHLQRLGVDGRITLKWSLKPTMEAFDWITLARDKGNCEHSNETSGYIKCVEFVDYLRNQQLLKKDSALRSELVGG
jgi:hypothetical protein